MKNTEWLKDCELCNNGVCNRIDELNATGMPAPPKVEMPETVGNC